MSKWVGGASKASKGVISDPNNVKLEWKQAGDQIAAEQISEPMSFLNNAVFRISDQSAESFSC